MKKLTGILLSLVFCVCAVPVLAAETPAADEIVLCYDRMYLELAADRPAETEVLRRALAAMPEVDWIEPGGGFIFDRDEENCLYWRIVLREPCEENYNKVEAFLADDPAVLRHTQNSYGVAVDEDGFAVEYSLSGLQVFTTIPDSDAGRVTQVQAEIASQPGVWDCDNNGIGEGNLADGTMLYFIILREPVHENYVAVLNWLQTQPYYAGILKDAMTIAPKDPVVCVYGDADTDGKVSAADAKSILRFAAKLEYPASYTLFQVCDMDQDGALTAADARRCLRTAVQLEKTDEITFVSPRYEGLIVSAEASLTPTSQGLALSAAVVGGPKVTKCGFSSVRLQRLTNGVWADVKGRAWQDVYENGSAAVFSKTVAVPGGTYRLVTLHYAEQPYILGVKHTASFTVVSTAADVPPGSGN